MTNHIYDPNPILRPRNCQQMYARPVVASPAQPPPAKDMVNATRVCKAERGGWLVPQGEGD